MNPETYAFTAPSEAKTLTSSWRFNVLALMNPGSMTSATVWSAVE